MDSKGISQKKRPNLSKGAADIDKLRPYLRVDKELSSIVRGLNERIRTNSEMLEKKVKGKNLLRYGFRSENGGIKLDSLTVPTDTGKSTITMSEVMTISDHKKAIRFIGEYLKKIGGDIAPLLRITISPITDGAKAHDPDFVDLLEALRKRKISKSSLRLQIVHTPKKERKSKK